MTTSMYKYLTDATTRQVAQSFVQDVLFIMINAVSYKSDGNFISVFPTITALSATDKTVKIGRAHV